MNEKIAGAENVSIGDIMITSFILQTQAPIGALPPAHSPQQTADTQDKREVDVFSVEMTSPLPPRTAENSWRPMRKCQG